MDIPLLLIPGATLVPVCRDIKLKLIIDRFYIALTTYTNRISARQFPTATFVSAQLYEFTVGLERVGVYSHISGMEGYSSQLVNRREDDLFDFIYGAISAITSLFYPVFGTLLTSLQPLFQDVSGVVNTCNDQSHSYINIVLEPTPTANFDSASFPVGFNIIFNDNPTATYQAYSEVTYLIDCVEAAFLLRTTQARTTNLTITD